MSETSKAAADNSFGKEGYVLPSNFALSGLLYNLRYIFEKGYATDIVLPDDGLHFKVPFNPEDKSLTIDFKSNERQYDNDKMCKMYTRAWNRFLDATRKIAKQENLLSGLDIDHKQGLLIVYGRETYFNLIQALIKHTDNIYDIDDATRAYAVKEKEDLNDAFGLMLRNVRDTENVVTQHVMLTEQQREVRAINQVFSPCVPYPMNDIAWVLERERSSNDQSARPVIH